ncbi:MAG: aminotransferase class I/II-fold pyridoxal phosphate-dependent enzyme [Campylobacterota bacterium]
MKHGAGIYKVAKKLHCKPSEIIDFSSNINSYNSNIDITLTKELLVKYGDSSYSDLKKIIAKKMLVKKKQIALYNGATSAIFELIKSLKSKDIYLYAPLYGEYEKAAKQSSKNIHKINRFKELNRVPKYGSTVVFVNPSTPDGKFYNLGKLFKLWKRQNCTVIMDESFLEFENLKSLRNQINNYKKLYVIQSFTKFYACAGVRIGAILSNKHNIQVLKTPLWNLSSFDVEYLSKRLQDNNFSRESKKSHKKMKKELLNILENSKLFSRVYKSDSNFILTKSKRAKKIFKHLYKNKILVRKCASFDFLSNEYLRFAVKDTNSHKTLTKVLNELT